MRWAQISWNLVIFVFSFFDVLELVTRHVNFDTQSLFRILQFYSFSGSRIAFWPENRDPDQIKHAMGPNIMDFNDFCILIFRNFEICSKLNNASYIYSIDTVSIQYRYCIDTVSKQDSTKSTKKTMDRKHGQNCEKWEYKNHQISWS